MDPPIFGELPTDMLVEIFQLLDAKTLENCTLVCRRWDQIIGSHAATMKKLKKRIGSLFASPGSTTDDTFRKTQVRLIKKSKRKLHSLIVDGPSDLYKYELKVAINLGATVRDLNLNKGNFKEALDLLPHFKLLETLHLLIFDKDDLRDQISVMAPIQLNHLKRLQIMHGALHILPLIEAPNLEVFELCSLFPILDDQHDREQFEKGCKFLAASHKLKTLKICTTSALKLIFAEESQRAFDFKLEKLHFPLLYDTHLKSFLKFLQSQAKSLEEVSFECFFRSLNQALKTTIPRLLKLKKLSMHCVLDYLNIPDAFKPILSIAPNLESLECLGPCNTMCVFSKNLRHIANCNLKLKNLTICRLLTFENVQFKHLEVLSLKSLDQIIGNLIDFLSINPKIKLLEFKRIYRGKDDQMVAALETMENSSELQQLKFNDRFINLTRATMAKKKRLS